MDNETREKLRKLYWIVYKIVNVIDGEPGLRDEANMLFEVKTEIAKLILGID